jgi:hypothetical protein
MPIAAISLGKRRVKVGARRRYPHRVRTPPGYEVLNSPANIRRIDCHRPFGRLERDARVLAP